MSRDMIFVLQLALILSCLIGCLSNSAITEAPLSTPYLKAFPPRLPPPPKDELEVDLDGKIIFLDESRKIQWSFASGGPICSSYQALGNNDKDKSNASGLNANDFYIDCGDDLSLYLYRKSFGKVKITTSAGDYIKNAPYVSKDGGVTLGSKKTTVFLVDAKSRRVVNTYKLDDYPSTSGPEAAEEKPVLLNEDSEELVEFGALNLKTVEQPLYVMRTDYVLQHHSPDNGKVLWNVTFAEFEAVITYPKNENSFGGISPSLEYRGDVDSQLFYQSKRIVLRIRDHLVMESLPAFGRLENDHSGGSPLSLPAPNHNSPSGAADLLQLAPHDNEGRQVKMPVKSKSQAHQLKLWRSMERNSMYKLGLLKRRELGRLGNNKRSANNQRMRKDISPENKVGDTKGLPLIEGNDWKKFSDLVDGRRIGKLLVSNKEIAKGSNGTIVLEGIYDSRPVAVKRLVQTHHDVALKEIQNLIASDQHPNIVRWYGVEYDQDFVYLALERCTCSLNDLIFLCSESFQSHIISKDQFSNFLNEYTAQLQTIKENNKDVELWKNNGYPTPQSLKLMRDVVSGLAHLHELGIIHRDLKPQNVLIIKERSLCAKLSDMGISKRLSGDMSSLTQHATGAGSSGGKHPYGDSIERDVNIVNDRKDLFLVENIPEAVDLFSNLLNPNPDMRPKVMDVLHHPFFWDSEMRLSFLRDASDRVELEDRENESELFNALESIAAVALNGKWDEKMEAAFINNIGHYRRYCKEEEFFRKYINSNPI
uniref:non-specific serine/threonine protein kinase n=1 Tax=Fagus sylvatica TaxID=28930 RepID=A0A2N9F8N1_FAGSY